VTDTAGGSEPGSRGRNTQVLIVGTLLSRVTGFGRIVALAYALGFTFLADAYTLANTVPNILYDLVLGGVLSATLIPVFVDRLSTSDEDEAWTAISAVASAVIAALLVLTAVFFLAAPWIIRIYTINGSPGQRAAQRALATTLLRLFVPQLALLGGIALTQALLNARRRFAAPAFSPVANNVLTIAVLLVVPHLAKDLSVNGFRHEHSAVLVLGLGTTAAYLAQLLFQLPGPRSNVHLRWVWDLRHPAVTAVLRLSGWTFGFVAANQVAFWISFVLVEHRSGGVAAYQAAYLFFQLPHAIFAVSVMSVITPELSERWARHDLRGFRHELGAGVRLTIAVLVPAAVGYVLLARPIVGLVLEHGALRHSSAELTADMLALFAVGLPGFSVYLLLMRAYQSMQNTRTMFLLYLAENAVNVVLALIFYGALGAPGVALAFGTSYVLGLIIAFADLRKRVGGVEGPRTLMIFTRVVVATSFMAAVVVVIGAVAGGGSDAARLLRVGGGVTLGVTVYLLVANRLGIDELSTLLRLRRRAA
jgi:putative peptidoglycan lipid II flippase